VDKIIIRDKALADLPELMHIQIQKSMKKAADNTCPKSEQQTAQDHEKKSAQESNSKPLFPFIQGKAIELTGSQLVYLICDDNTYQAAAQQALKILQQSDFNVELIRLSSGDKPIKPTPTMLYHILQGISQPGWLLACGSGTINDLVKFAASRTGLPSGVLATAPSMDGYTSGVASLVVEGVKQTTPTGPHNFILADPEILAAAPERMILAGVGDLLGKATSLLDWHLRRIIFDDYFCKTAEALIRKPLENLLADNFTRRLRQRDSAALKELTRGLLNSGLAMQLVGSSSPASGSEHHISHFLEMLGLREKIPMPLHGIKVGIGTYFTAGFYLRLLEEGLEILTADPITADSNLAEAFTGSWNSKETRQERIIQAYGSRQGPAIQNLQERWPRESSLSISLAQLKELKSKIAEFKPLLEKARQYLKRNKYFDLAEDISDEQLRQAVLYGFEIRQRFTITTLLYQLGWLEDWTDSLLAESPDS